MSKIEKTNEPFKPDLKSKKPPPNLIFRLVKRSDRNAIVDLTSLRNPNQLLADIQKKTDQEILNVETDSNYLLYVTEHDGQVIGFCRFYNCTALPETKRIYPAPDGWYGMGIMVAPEMRRHSIARFMSINRFNILREKGVSEIYSIVDANNLTSQRMHEKFGYEKVSEAEGFLHVKLESGRGYLYRKTI